MSGSRTSGVNDLLETQKYITGEEIQIVRYRSNYSRTDSGRK